MRNSVAAIFLFFAAMSAAAAANCYRTTIQEPQPFLGTGDGSEIIILSDGSIWKDVSYQYLYLYEYFPSVVICPSAGKMILGEHEFRVVRIR